MSEFPLGNLNFQEFSNQTKAACSQLLALTLVTSSRTQRPHDLSNRVGLLSIYFYSPSSQSKHKLCLSSPLQRVHFLLFLKNFSCVWLGVNALLGLGSM